MACYKSKDGKCSVNGIECSGNDESLDCFMELENQPAPEKTAEQKLIEKIDQSMEKIDNALISNASLKADFLQLKKDFDTLRNRCNNAIEATIALRGFGDLISQIADKIGYTVNASESGLSLVKKPAKRKTVKKVAKKSAKKPVKKARR